MKNYTITDLAYILELTNLDWFIAETTQVRFDNEDTSPFILTDVDTKTDTLDIQKSDIFTEANHLAEQSLTLQDLLEYSSKSQFNVTCFVENFKIFEPDIAKPQLVIFYPYKDTAISKYINHCLYWAELTHNIIHFYLCPVEFFDLRQKQQSIYAIFAKRLLEITQPKCILTLDNTVYKLLNNKFLPTYQVSIPNQYKNIWQNILKIKHYLESEK